MSGPPPPWPGTGPPAGPDRPSGSGPVLSPGRRGRPRRPTTYVRDFALVWLHLGVYLLAAFVTVAGLQVAGGRLPLIPGEMAFEVLFLPPFIWGTLIAAHAGTALFQHRRVMGFVVGAAASVYLGGLLLSQVYSYQDAGHALRTVAPVTVVAAVAISVLRRPPFIGAGRFADRAAPRPGVSSPPRLDRRTTPWSLRGVVLGAVALVFVVSSVTAGIYRSLDVRGSGTVVSRTVALGSADTLSFTGSGTLLVRDGPVASLTVTGDDNLLDFLAVSTDAGTITVGIDAAGSGPAARDVGVRYEVTIPDLSSLVVGGGLRVTIEPDVGREGLGVIASGDASVSLNGRDGGGLSLDIRDRARVQTGGRADSLGIAAGDRSSYDGGGFAAGSATVAVTGSARVSLGATVRLRYTQSGLGAILCRGGTAIDPASTAVIPQCRPAGGPDVRSPVAGPVTGPPGARPQSGDGR